MDPAIVSIGPPETAKGKSELEELLEPYTKQELCQLITDTATNDIHFKQQFVHLLRHDQKWCKLFVHGLSYQTTNASLHEFYSQFGQLKEAVVLMDKKGQSKGFGFVSFVNREGALAATKLDRHKIDNRITHCCLAFVGNPRKLDRAASPPPSTPQEGPRRTSPSLPDSAGQSQQGSAAPPSSTPMSPIALRSSPHPPNNDPSRSERRLFVHSLAWKTDDETLRNTFAQYGQIEEAIVIRDKKSQKSKGYGFVVFTDAESARKALAEPEKTIDGRTTKCNLACERAPTTNPPPVQASQPTHPMFAPMMGQPVMQPQLLPNLQGLPGQAMPFIPQLGGVAPPLMSSAGQPVLQQMPIPSGPPSLPSLSGMQPQGLIMGNFGNGSVSSCGQPFSPFARPPSSVSSMSGAQGVLVPFGNMQMQSVGSVQPMQPTGATPGAPRTIKIVAVPNGNRAMAKVNGHSALRQQSAPGRMSGSHVHRGRPVSSVNTESVEDDMQSGRSSPVTQGSRTPELEEI